MFFSVCPSSFPSVCLSVCSLRWNDAQINVSFVDDILIEWLNFVGASCHRKLVMHEKVICGQVLQLHDACFRAALETSRTTWPSSAHVLSLDPRDLLWVQHNTIQNKYKQVALVSSTVSTTQEQQQEVRGSIFKSVTVLVFPLTQLPHPSNVPNSCQTFHLNLSAN